MYQKKKRVPTGPGNSSRRACSIIGRHIIKYTFDRAACYSRRVFFMMMLASFGGFLLISLLNEDPPLLVPVVCYLVALFAGCMVCHGEVVRLNPPAAHLTRFYLYLAGGGALGGVVVAIIAPMIFDDYLEFPSILVLIPLAWMGAAGMNAVARARNFYGTLTVAEYGQSGTRGSHRRILHGLQCIHQDLEHLPRRPASPAGGAARVVLGDPRLVLEREPPRLFI